MQFCLPLIIKKTRQNHFLENVRNLKKKFREKIQDFLCDLFEFVTEVEECV